MNSINGIITRSGKLSAGQRITAYQEITFEFDLNGSPDHPRWPSVYKLGEAYSDKQGEFDILFEPIEQISGDCIISSSVFIRVMDGTETWTSIKRPMATNTEFSMDLQPDTQIDAIIIKSILHGTISACGGPATGYTVKGFEKVTRGAIGPDGHFHVTITVHALGHQSLDPNGQYFLSFTPSPTLGGDQAPVPKMYIEVYDGLVLLWKSPETPETAITTLNGELFPGCAVGKSVIIVIGDNDVTIPKAEVFLNGTKIGVTDNSGQLQIAGLTAGNQLAARVLIKESASPRHNHSEGGTQNWNYRVYTTSVPVRYDANGNNVTLPQKVVVDSTAIQYLRISPNNALVGFNILVSIEWDITAAELENYSDRLKETSELLYNATDGQFLLEYIHISDNGTFWNDADIQVLANTNYASDSSLNGLQEGGRAIKMNPYNAFFPGIYLHELGHYLFGVGDEYKGPSGATYCTHKSTIHGTPFSDGGSKDSCPMRGSQYNSRKKFCSNHPENPHQQGTNQGVLDCWTTIANAYHGNQWWKIWTPDSRLVIPDRLPDSGISLDTSTSVPSGVDQAGSYIPIKGWKPRIHTSNIIATAELPGQKIRAMYGGTPLDGAKVYLHNTLGHSIYQGLTGAHGDLAGGVSTRAGEIILHGTHQGNRVEVSKTDGFSVYYGLHVIVAGDPATIDVIMYKQTFSNLLTTLAIKPGGNMPKVQDTTVSMLRGQQTTILQNFGAGQVQTTELGTEVIYYENNILEMQALQFDREGEPHYLRGAMCHYRVDGHSASKAFSFDNQLEIELPAGAMNTPTELVIEEIMDTLLPSDESGYRILGGPFNIRATNGDDLKKPATLFARPGGVEALYSRSELKELKFELLQYNTDSKSWIPCNVTKIDYPLVLTATVKSLGIYALAQVIK